MPKNDFFWTTDRADEIDVPFNFIIGGRGTGKTYRKLWQVKEEAEESDDSKFLYARRTEVEVATIGKEGLNPYKKLNRDKGWDIKANYVRSDNYGIFYTKDLFYGFAAALSTFGNIRGADLCDVQTIVFDEFIRPKTKHIMAGEADAFFNMYETIARNREIAYGDHAREKPVKCWLLSNSTSMDSPILMELGLDRVIDMMRRKGQSYYTDRERGIHIELLRELGITEAKKETALYKLTKGSRYYAHAIDNEFAYDSFENIRKRNLSYYTCFMQVDNIFIYQHKYTGKFYACQSQSKAPYRYTGDSLPLFRKIWGVRIYASMVDGTMEYSDFNTKITLFHIFDGSNN